MGEHSDATIGALDIDAPGRVTWWPRPDVKLFNVLVHLVTEASRHAGHADGVRELIDGGAGFGAKDTHLLRADTVFRVDRFSKIEQAAKTAALRDGLT